MPNDGERRTRKVGDKTVTEEWVGGGSGAFHDVDAPGFRSKAPASNVPKSLPAPAAADLEDKPEDSPLIKASKKRQRAQRDAMKK